MGQPIELTRLELSASDLRGWRRRPEMADGVRRLLAIALVLDGYSREAAAAANGMTRQTLRDWVHRFNADGVTGLRSRASPGRRQLRMTRLQPRPYHPKKDLDAEVAFKKQARTGGPPVAVETGRAMLLPEGSGRTVFGGPVPGKKRGP